MPRVIIIPYNQLESVCQDAIVFANSCQSDFTFYLIPQAKNADILLNKKSIEFTEILAYLEGIKRIYNYEENDLILTFYDGILEASEYGLTNLFLAGARYDEQPPCTCVISVKYMDWNILELKYNYEVQKHSILHLIVCAIISAYTHLEAHRSIGCLLDFNENLSSFNLKLQKGYHLCSNKEYNCYNKIKNEKYGNSILRLCESFKGTKEGRNIPNFFAVNDRKIEHNHKSIAMTSKNNPWISGSFYLFVFIIVIMGLAVVSNIVH